MLLVPRYWSPLLSGVELRLRSPEWVRREAVEKPPWEFPMEEVYLYLDVPGCGLFETLCYHCDQQTVHRHS